MFNSIIGQVSLNRCSLQASFQTYCKRLNDARIEILEDLKTGFVKLPVEVIKAVEKKSPGLKALKTFV